MFVEYYLTGCKQNSVHCIWWVKTGSEGVFAHGPGMRSSGDK